MKAPSLRRQHYINRSISSCSAYGGSDMLTVLLTSFYRKLSLLYVSGCEELFLITLERIENQREVTLLSFGGKKHFHKRRHLLCLRVKCSGRKSDERGNVSRSQDELRNDSQFASFSDHLPDFHPAKLESQSVRLKEF
ncbi:hypothetical protein J6590_052239 [Homalodisca vitripennis]|nr:hypothetical protein J6590_052239 [Homalodisca vitripennis]